MMTLHLLFTPASHYIGSECPTCVSLHKQ